MRATRRFDLAALILVQCLLFAPYLSPAVAPVHDSAMFFEYFHYFYSSVASGQGIPRWLPFEAYGVPSDITQLDFMSPAGYLMTIFGRLFGVDDVLLLFKASVFVECLTLLLGVYLLAQVLFRDRVTRLIVCLSAIGSTIWYAQLHFNLRFYYLAPLALYGLARFLNESRVRWLAVVGVTLLAWLLGDRAYYAILWAFAGTVLGLVLTPPAFRAIRRLTRRQAAALALAVGLVAGGAGVYVYLVQEGRDDVVVQAPERQASGRVRLRTFLTYGGYLNKPGVIRRMLAGFPTHLPNGSGREESIYCGLPMVFFFLLAFFAVRDVWFSAIAAAMLAVVALSFAGGFARLMYFVPGMNFYRHITTTYGLVKLLLILSAGFGIDRFWQLSPRGRALLYSVGVLLCGAAALGLQERVMLLRAAVYGAVGVAGMVIWRRHELPILQWGLAAALVVDLALFQTAVFAEVPRLTAAERPVPPITDLRPAVWHTARSRVPETEPTAEAMQWATRPGILATYGTVLTFSGFDSCVPAERLDFRTVGVDRYLSSLAADVADDPVIGCDQPKLRLVRQAGRTVGESVEFEALTPVPARSSSAARDDEDPEVLAFSTNALTVRARAPVDGRAWLLYADAFHPGWRATVNDRPATVFAAFDAFKAVRLVPGANVVRLEFRRPLADALNTVVVCFGASFALVVLFGCVVITAGEWRGRRGARGVEAAPSTM